MIDQSINHEKFYLICYLQIICSIPNHDLRNNFKEGVGFELPIHFEMKKNKKQKEKKSILTTSQLSRRAALQRKPRRYRPFPQKLGKRR
jgi:hypothetical protein